MPNRCVVGECSNTPNLKEGISLYIIPFFDDPRPEAKKRRKKWVDFVSMKRLFNPSKNSAVCSKHFTDDDFTTRFSVLPGQTGKPIVRLLRRDEFGICVYPTKYSAEEISQSDRSRRMVSIPSIFVICFDFVCYERVYIIFYTIQQRFRQFKGNDCI